MSQPWEALGGRGDRAPDALSGEFQTGGGCTHTHTYTPHTQSHTYTHTFTQAFTHTHSFTHIHSTHPPTHTSYTQHTHTLTHSHTHTQTHTYTQHTQLHPPTHTNHTHTTPTHTLTCTHTHTHTQTLKPALSWGTGWRGGQSWAGGRSLAPLRSVYLHNNQLSNAGLPPDAFRGSEAVATLSLSSNQLSYVPPSLPPSLERLHLQVPLSARPLPRPHSPRGPAPPSWGATCHPSTPCRCPPPPDHPHVPTPLGALHLRPGGSLVIPAVKSVFGSFPQAWVAHRLSLSSLAQKNTLSLTQEPPVPPYCPLPWTLSLILSSLPRTTSSPRCPEEP